jgi:hypothetical protein
MEKLMMHLKLESASKLRTLEQLRLSEKAVIKLKEKCELMNKKSAAKDRLILELREGSKILEDQLRLMDEKYLELRTKLDYARETGVRKVKRAERTAHELRMKFALSGSSVILDKMPLPDIFRNSSPSEILGYQGGMFNDPGIGVPGQDSILGDSSMGDMMAPTSWSKASAASASAATSMGKGNHSNSKSKLSRNRQGLYGSGYGNGNGNGNGNGSGANYGLMSTTSSEERMRMHPEPSMDVVLEKIRRHQGGKQDWTEDKLKDLISKSR